MLNPHSQTIAVYAGISMDTSQTLKGTAGHIISLHSFPFHKLTSVFVKHIFPHYKFNLQLMVNGNSLRHFARRGERKLSRKTW